jgi:hypothetical protein
VKKKELTDLQQSILRKNRVRKHQTGPLKIKPNSSNDGIEIVDPGADLDGQLFRTFGTKDRDCANFLLSQIAQIHPDLNDTNATTIINACTPLLAGIGPRDELELMLAVQMLGIHSLSLEMIKRAAAPKATAESVNFAINRAVKLSKTFTAQIEALNKYRGKNEQKMIVEHVTVNKGGQAIVGNVEQGGGEG